MTSPYDWFADCVSSNLMVTLSAVREPDAASLLAAFGSAGFDLGHRTLDEVQDLPNQTVRIGAAAGWTYAVEHRTVHGGDPTFLERLTAGRGEALAVCFTPTISSFLYAAGGRLVTGFDIAAPQFRYGSEQHAFDREMVQAGLLREDGFRPAAACADFLAHAFGFVITRGMLEDRLPCATLSA